jgi:PAS domain S-box-containing protein
MPRQHRVSEPLRYDWAEIDRFFNLSPDLLCITGPDGYLMRVNAAFIETLEWSVDDLLARPLIDFVHPLDRAATLREMARCVNLGERSTDFINRYLHKDGSWRRVSWDTAPGPGGLTYGVGRHCAELQQADAAQRRLAAIIESSDDAIVSKTVDGIITSWNPAAARIFGYSAHEMIGQPITIIIPPDRANEEQDILDRIRRGERVDHFETVRVTKDGRSIDVSVSASPIKDGTGKIIGASKIVRDLPERERTDRALAAANRELAAFTSLFM